MSLCLTHTPVTSAYTYTHTNTYPKAHVLACLHSHKLIYTCVHEFDTKGGSETEAVNGKITLH